MSTVGLSVTYACAGLGAVLGAALRTGIAGPALAALALGCSCFRGASFAEADGLADVDRLATVPGPGA
ncbi:hypothetical protein [Streptomyces sclerotialus]|uniref:hypothetical protein n=1 Tax=Streptomyces sclerotialus TaxID=1957 RepID=UPI0004C7D5ED